jgi:predicted MFS family arabinose efflux permease
LKKSTFFIFCLEGALLSFNVAASAALIPSIAGEFALSQFLVGRIIWVYMLTYGVAAFFYGPLVRRFDARRIELTCIFFFSFANLLVALSWNIYSLFLGRFFMGLFGASVIPLGLILIGKHQEREKKGKYIGIFFSATFIASLLGLFLSGVIYWRWIFIIPAFFGFVLWGVMYYKLPSFKDDITGLKFNYFKAFKDRVVLRILTYIFLISLIYHAVQQWLGVYFSTEFGLNQFTISMLITLTSLSGIFGELWGGALADSIGRSKTVDLGLLLMIISIILLIFKVPLALLILTMGVWGLGWTFNHAGLATMLTDLPDEFLNEAASLNSGIRFISGGIGMVFGGLVMSRSFSLGFILFGLGLLSLLFLDKFKKPKIL